MSLESIVMAVYKVKRYQVTGGPKWLDSDRFDVVANLAGDPGAPGARGSEAAARLIAAAQSMLAERFQLVFHHDTRLLPGYALAVAKGGPRLKPTAGDISTIRTTRTSLKATGYSMEQFASSLSTELGEPVLDTTGLAGAFDFELEWAQAEAGAALSDRPSFFTALQETLGLKLAAMKTPTAILVIDRADRPDAN